jgi:UDP-N-acetylmuramate dehydrogenase
LIHIDLKGNCEENLFGSKVVAGMNLLWTIDQNFGGLENMSLIPGNVGTTPVKTWWEPK